MKTEIERLKSKRGTTDQASRPYVDVAGLLQREVNLIEKSKRLSTMRPLILTGSDRSHKGS